MSYLAKIKTYIIVLLTILGLVLPALSYSDNFAHIEQLFDVRTSIADQDKNLPDAIREARGDDLRTLERIFELNTSTLTTIEAYFRIFKISLSPDKNVDPEALGIINEWLAFIQNQCNYDTEYLDQALSETTNESVVRQITISKENIERLAKSTQLGIQENNRILQEQSGN